MVMRLDENVSNEVGDAIIDLCVSGKGVTSVGAAVSKAIVNTAFVRSLVDRGCKILSYDPRTGDFRQIVLLEPPFMD